ncbi:MAG: sulfurtransferase [Ktedonobacteraceae bacterium]
MEVKTLVSAIELSTHMKTDPIVIIDTRAPEEYAISHIPGAVNIREIFSYLSTSTSEGLATLQNMFADLLGKAGLSGKELAVIYEDAMNNGYGQSCRGYFLLKFLGYPHVSILHGGYNAWQAAGLPTSTQVPTPEAKVFPLHIDSSMLIDKDEMLKSLDDPSIIKLDVRDFDEWTGESSSPYGVDFCPRKGRIPGAVLIEWYSMMKMVDGIPMFRPKEEMLATANEVGIKPDSTVNIYCFKGARASNTLVALNEAGVKDVRVYFASWNEWSRDPSLPIEEGTPDPKRPAIRATVQA